MFLEVPYSNGYFSSKNLAVQNLIGFVFGSKKVLIKRFSINAIKLFHFLNTFYLFSAPYFIIHVAAFLYCFYINILEFLVNISLVFSQLYISTC